MAINSEKLLPPSKSAAFSSVAVNRPSTEIHRRYSGRLAMQKSLQEKMVSGGPTNVVLTKKSVKNIGIIKTKVIEIESILKGTLASEKKALDEKKRQESGKRREKQEEKLETRPSAEKGIVKMPSVPRLGIFDWIKNFIGNIILGYFAVRLIDHLPKIIPILKFIGKATDFVIDIGGKLLNGLATFIDWGYKAYDSTRGFLKNLGGEDFAKGFDKFIGALDTAVFLTTFLAADLLAESLSGGDGGGPGGGRPGGRPGKGGGRYGFGRDSLGRDMTHWGFKHGKDGGAGWQGFNLWKQRGAHLEGVTLEKTQGDIMKRYFQRYGRDAFVQRFGQEGLERLPGGMARSGVTKFARNAFVGLAGKGGAKAILGTVRPLLKRLPIIGALIDFGLSWALGEDPGRAAFKAIGAGLLGSIGTALGGGIGLAGGPLALVGATIGGLAGSMAGDAIGGALYDMFFGNKKPQQKSQKVEKKAGGGITRGGKTLGGIKRTATKQKYKRVITRKPSKTQFKADPKDPQVKVGEELDKTKYFGPILAVTNKLQLKEEPTQKDYDNIGLGLNLLIAKGIEDKQLKGGLVAAFAEGGMVDSDFLEAAEKGADISSWISITFKNEFETNAQKTLRLIKDKKDKKDKQLPDKSDPTLTTPDDALPSGTLTEGQWGPLLDLIAGKESGGNYEAMYPSTRLPGATKMTIAEVARRATGAVGKYQQLPQYLVGRAKAAGLNPEKDLYSPENQEKIIINVNIKGRGGERWLKGEISDEQFMQGLSQEFASLPNAQGVFYYPGQRSSMTPAKVKAALSRVRGGGYSRAEIASSKSGTFLGGGIGSGYGSGGVKIAGDLGDFMKANKGKIGVTGEIHQHPRHPGQFRRNYRSYHNENRALDIGGWGPAHPSSGGRDEQAPVIRALLEWNKKNGYTPVEIIHGSPAFKGLGKYESAPNALHSNHVHVAYAKGGFVRGLTKAILGERGIEFVLDTDTTTALEQNFPGFLDALNKANYDGAISVLRNYAEYEKPYSQPEIQYVEVPVPMPVEIETQSPGMIAMFGDNEFDPFATLYQGT